MGLNLGSGALDALDVRLGSVTPPAVYHGSVLVWPLVAGGGGGGGLESIATITVGATPVELLTFSNIPTDGTYKHLQLRFLSRSDYAQVSESPGIRFNTDSGANYNFHFLNGDGTSAYSSGDPNRTSANFIGTSAAANSGSNIFGATIFDILDYADTSKNTTIRALGGHDRNGGGVVSIGSAAWRNTAAVNSITIYTASLSGRKWVQHTTAALYGLKGEVV